MLRRDWLKLIGGVITPLMTTIYRALKHDCDELISDWMPGIVVVPLEFIVYRSHCDVCEAYTLQYRRNRPAFIHENIVYVYLF